MDATQLPDRATSPSSRDALVVSNVSKRFGTTLALDDVSLSLAVGEARALLGRNGAGKSTLISLITGIQTADTGVVSFGADSAKTAAEAVACVYQRSTLVPGLTAAENISLGSFPTRGGFVRWAAVDRRARNLLGEWNCAYLADRLVEDLDPLHRKIVEVCRALSAGAGILLLDEPTAGLDADATRRLFDHIAALRARGVTVVYVSHYLEEVFEVCDTVTILRDGRNVMNSGLESLTVNDIVEAMIGDVDELAAPGESNPDLATMDVGERTVLHVDGLTAAPLLERFDVEIREGECVGLVGLDGSGIVDVAEALSGIRIPDAGSISIDGHSVPSGSVVKSINAGIGFLPEDRHHSGFVPGMGNEENATLTILDRIRNRFGLIDGRRRRAIYDDLASRWNIKAASATQATEELSGGNQQKVALARAFATQPRVLILVNPTAGVDVAAKANIFETIVNAVKADGRAALIISADESEFEICSRLLVMFRGRVVAELAPPWSEQILAAAVQGSTDGRDDDTTQEGQVQ